MLMRLTAAMPGHLQFCHFEFRHFQLQMPPDLHGQV
jgi:hypothetical protein